MLEETIRTILLALHNIALVGCAAAPFYNRNLVNTRAQYGPKLHYELDKVVEETLQGNAPYCMVFILVLFATGIGMPLNHFFFHGALKEVHVVATIGLILKLLSVFGMVAIMVKIFFFINPILREIFGSFAPKTQPEPEKEKRFFALRAKRKALCELCLKFSVLVLIFSAFLTFGG